MISFTQLLLPIALSAVFVFVVSSVIHMVIRWHTPDYRKLPNEDEVCAAIRKGNVSPGQYVFPHMLDPKECKDPANQKKLVDGPVGVVYVRPNGMPNMGSFLGAWFAYTLVVGALCAYLASFTLGAQATYLEVFRVVGVAAWLGYAWQSPSDSIWKGKPWIITARGIVDGLAYALVTAGTFAWLWPR